MKWLALKSCGRGVRRGLRQALEICEALEERGVNCAFRLPANENLKRDIAELLPRPQPQAPRVGFIVTNLSLPSRAGCGS
jgi:hypothetical protein